MIVLTAMDAVDRKLQLLSIGADDYITKPFNSDELLARVKVQFRKQDGPEARKIGLLELKPNERLVTWNGRDVPLSPREFALLMVLARQPGRIINREELMREVWDRTHDQDSNLVDVHLANLRGKFRDAGAHRVVRTVRGVGYGLYMDG